MATRWLQPQRHRKCNSTFKNFVFPEKKDALQLAQEESREKVLNDIKKIKRR